MDKITTTSAIRRYFSTEEHPVQMAELQTLSTEDRMNLAQMVAAELGLEIVDASQA
jgi:hypothetical protein